MFANPHARLFAGAVVISFSAVFVKLVAVPPTASGVYRTLFGGIALLLIVAFRRERMSFDARGWLVLALAAVFFAMDIFAWHHSVVLIGPGLATLLGNFQAFFLMAAGVLFLNQRPTRRQVLAVPLALAGLGMIVGLDWPALPQDYRAGVIYGLLTAVFYASYLLTMRLARLRSPDGLPNREMAVMSLMSATVLAGFAGLEGVSLAIPTAADASWLVLYGVLGNCVGMTLIASSLSQVTAPQVGLALLLQPALSIVWDMLLFGRRLTAIEAGGAALALAAIYLGSQRASQQA